MGKCGGGGEVLKYRYSTQAAGSFVETVPRNLVRNLCCDTVSIRPFYCGCSEFFAVKDISEGSWCIII